MNGLSVGARVDDAGLSGSSDHFSEDAWRHILLDHAELQPFQDAIRATVEHPNLCAKESDASLNYYRRGVLAAWPQLYLHVLAREDGEGVIHIRTAWPSKRIDPFEEVLCLTIAES